MIVRMQDLLNDPEIAALIDERVELVNRDLIQYLQGGLYLVGLGRTLEGLDHNANTDLSNLVRLMSDDQVGLVMASFSSEARENMALNSGKPVSFGKREIKDKGPVLAPT